MGKVPGEVDELHAVNGAVDVQRLALFQDRFGGVDVGIQSLGSWSHVCERKNKNGYCLIENKSSDERLGLVNDDTDVQHMDFIHD